MEGLCLTQLPISPEAVRQTKHSHYFNWNQATAAVCFPALSSAPTMACAVHPASSASCVAKNLFWVGICHWRAKFNPIPRGKSELCVAQPLHLVIRNNFTIYLGGKVETVTDFIFLGSKIMVDSDCSHEMKRHLLLGRKAMANLDRVFKSRNITLLTKVHYSQSYGFSSSHVWMWELYHKEGWTLKNWCFPIVVLE